MNQDVDILPLIVDCSHGCDLFKAAILSIQTGDVARATEMLYRAVELQKAIATLLEALIHDKILETAT